jgi:hypothetical protein
MKILALEQEVPGIAAAAFTPALLQAEAARVWELQQAAVVREIHFRQDRSAAVLVLECADAAEAQRLLGTLPLVRAGLIGFEVIPLKPYPGLARLFGADRAD